MMKVEKGCGFLRNVNESKNINPKESEFGTEQARVSSAKEKKI